MVRFVRQESFSLETLLDVIRRAESGLVDADLGGGLIKQRISRKGPGRSGGYRTVIAYRRADRAVFLLGFAKRVRSNITPDETAELRKIGSNWLNASSHEIAEAVNQNKLEEVTL